MRQNEHRLVRLLLLAMLIGVVGWWRLELGLGLLVFVALYGGDTSPLQRAHTR